jgi:hypothetical protein
MLDDFRLDLLVRAAHDEVGLWEVWRVVQRHRRTDRDSQRAEALAALEDLLEAGYLKAGQFSRDEGWTWWEKPTDQIIRQLDQDWQALGRDPDLGDIAWFTSTPAGDQYLQGLPQRGNRSGPG